MNILHFKAPSFLAAIPVLLASATPYVAAEAAEPTVNEVVVDYGTDEAVSTQNAEDSLSAQDILIEGALAYSVSEEPEIIVDGINETEGVIMDEKIAVDPHFVFNGEEENRWILEDAQAMSEPTGESYAVTDLSLGTQVYFLGENEFGTAKILTDMGEGYIDIERLTNDKNQIFFEDDSTAWALDNIEVFGDYKGEETIGTIERGTELSVTGKNDSDFLRISFQDRDAFVLKQKITSYGVPGVAYMGYERDGITEYYEENMIDGVLAEVSAENQSDEDLYHLAQIIRCEAGNQTMEGKRAVGTVIINRLYRGYWGDTLMSVIEAPHQFEPVSRGTFYTAVPTESDMEAARQVLLEGYRSFPAYVMYFQSIEDGYFNGHVTYLTSHSENMRSSQYFSYTASDLARYSNSSLTT